MNGAKGVWGWLGQRLTAVGLVLVLGTHLWVLHFAPEPAALTLAGVTIRLKALSYLLVDSFLLAFGLYHGLYGLRSVLLDYFPGERPARAITALCWVVGVAFLILGVATLVPLVTR
ncbi:MAG: hypothetical protein K6U08_10155 [Firmicutes bacterium]|nr:hypothetical protein [Bacillota bacterium]